MMIFPNRSGQVTVFELFGQFAHCYGVRVNLTDAEAAAAPSAASLAPWVKNPTALPPLDCPEHLGPRRTTHILCDQWY